MESFLVSDDFAMFQTESLPVPGANLAQTIMPAGRLTGNMKLHNAFYIWKPNHAYDKLHIKVVSLFKTRAALERGHCYDNDNGYQ